MDVYQKLHAQYQNADKPITYQYKNIPSSVRQKKFGVIIDRIIKMLQKGMKDRHLQATEDDQYYWNYFVDVFKNYKNERLDFNMLNQEKLKDKLAEDKWWEIYYVEDEMHLPVAEKVKEWIVLLLANHKLFETLDVIAEKLNTLFVDSNYMQSKQYNDLKKSISFLSDYQFRVTCDLVGDYEQYCAQRKQREFLEGLEEIKRIKNAILRQQEQRRYDLEKIGTISKGLFGLIMKEIEIIQQKQRQQQRRKQNELMKKQQINQPVVQLPTYFRPPTSIVESTVDLHGANMTPGFHNYQPHIKKSQKLYRQQFEQLQNEFQFDLEPQESQQKTICAECGAKLSVGLYVIGNNQNYCHYTGKWYCNDCIAPQRIQIPWKALKSFDLRGYTVNKKSFYDIKAYQQKPIIQIPVNAMVIQNNRQLFQFLVVKRQIHLMYDSICNIQLIQKVLNKKINYCLKKNLFSLHNLYSIYIGSQLPALEQLYNMLEIHFNRCGDCLKKGYICKICNKPDRIFTFQLRQTKGCNQCRKLYHVNCLRYKPCICSNK